MTEAVGVVGIGNSARALACYLSQRGHDVHMLVRRPERFPWLMDAMAITATGKIHGTFPLSSVTDHANTFASRVRTIFVATVATAYADVAERLAPHLTHEHTTILFSGKLCGSVLFEHVLREHGAWHMKVLETDAIFACRVQPDESIWVRGIKGWTLYSAPRRSHTGELGPRHRHFFPNLEPARTVIQRGLTDFGALAHPTTMIANMNAVDRKEPFRFYVEGFTEKTVSILEDVEREFHLIAKAYGADIIAMKELLHRYYGCDTTTLLTAMRTVPNYRDSPAPQTLDHRYLKEDVQCTHVPLQALARKAGLEVPLIDSIVQMACDLTGEDLVHKGRTLERLGWAHKSHHEIQTWIEG